MAQFSRQVRPRMRDSWYLQFAAGVSATLTALLILVVHAIAGIPLSVTLRATVAPLLRFFASDPDVVEWAARSALVENAGPLFLVTALCLAAIVFLLVRPTDETVVKTGQQKGSASAVQRALNSAGRRKK